MVKYFCAMRGAKRKSGREAPASTKSQKVKEPEEPELMSDEDLEGGFEDLEGDFEDVEADGDSAQDDVVTDSLDEDEDEDEDGTEPVTSDGTGAGNADARREKSASAFAIPSNQEIQGLKETSELYMNNVFKLQLEEMVKQSQPRFHDSKALEIVLKRLQKLFSSLPSIEPAPLGEAREALADRFGRDILIPFAAPLPKETAPYRFSFEKPDAISLVGSWPLRTAVRRTGLMDADVEVTMPSGLFQEKDTLNARYFHKRAFYLAVLAESICDAADRESAHGQKIDVDVRYMDLDGDRRRTCIVLNPRKGGATDFSKSRAVVRIHLAHPADLFPTARLAPSRNNLRSNDAEGALAVPTPRYNTAILCDALRVAHLVFLDANARACAAFAEASQLLKVWATQRGYGTILPSATSTASHEQVARTVAGSGNARFLLTMLLAHLLNGAEKPAGSPRPAHVYRAKLSTGFSSFQLFRGTLDFLAKHNFATDAIFMRAQPRFGLASRRERIVPSDFLAHFARAFVDPSGTVNLFADWPAASVDMLQHDAAQTMRMLRDADADNFNALFLTPRSLPVLRFDELARVKLPAAKGSADVAENVARLDAGDVACGIDRILQVSARALGQRQLLVGVCKRMEQPYATDSVSESAHRGDRTFELGVLLSPTHAWKQVEHGPPPEQAEEAAAFRTFWGDIAELRRFRDGRVLESVVWPTTSLEQRDAIPRRILKYALERHGAVKSLRFFGSAFEGITTVAPALATCAYVGDPSQKGFTLVQSAYESLSKQLRALDELPLSVTGTAPADAALRSMSTFIPGALNLGELGVSVPDTASYLRAQHVVLTLESSGRWPDDLAAIQAMKTAIYERLAVALQERISGAIVHVAYDDDATSDETIEDQTCLEIIMPAGFAFALRINHDRERVLLERVVRDKSEPQVHRTQATRALARYDATFIHATEHHAALAALQHRYAGLADTVRMVKRWFGAQMLSPHVREEAVELLCVSVFTSSERSAPATSAAGFVAVLDMLSRWDWRESPLLVALDTATNNAGKLEEPGAVDISANKDSRNALVAYPAENRTEAEQNFRRTRASDPTIRHHAWFIATDTSTAPSAWCRDAPAAGIAGGIRQLATRAMTLLTDHFSCRKNDVLSLFYPSLEHYDFVVHVDPSIHSRYLEALDALPQYSFQRGGNERASRNFVQQSDIVPSRLGTTPRAGFDSVGAYVSLLESIFGDTFRLFYDAYGGTAIGGIWNPVYASSKGHPFKVLLGYTSRPLEDERVSLNKEGVLAEVQRLGNGIVMRVDST